MTKQTRNVVAGLLLFLAAGSGIVGFIVGKAATDSYRPQPPGMWVAYAFAGLLVLGAIIVWSGAGSSGPAKAPAMKLEPGWYDDPESPKMLRYWDGTQWTAKTANKE